MRLNRMYPLMFTGRWYIFTAIAADKKIIKHFKWHWLQQQWYLVEMWHQTRLRSSIFHDVEGFPWCLPVAVASLAPVGAGPVACVQLYSTVHVYSVTSGAQCSPASHMVRISLHPPPPTPSPRQWKYNSKWTIYLLLILVNHYKEICRYVFENLTIKHNHFNFKHKIFVWIGPSVPVLRIFQEIFSSARNAFLKWFKLNRFKTI